MSAAVPKPATKLLTVVPCAVLVGQPVERASCIPLFHTGKLVRNCDWLHVVYRLSALLEKSESDATGGILAMLCSSEDLTVYQPCSWQDLGLEGTFVHPGYSQA